MAFGPYQSDVIKFSIATIDSPTHETEKHSKGVILYVFEGVEFNQVVKFKLKGQGHKGKVKVITKIGLKLAQLHKTTQKGINLQVFEGFEINQVAKFKLKGQGHTGNVKVRK